MSMLKRLKPSGQEVTRPCYMLSYKDPIHISVTTASTNISYCYYYYCYYHYCYYLYCLPAVRLGGSDCAQLLDTMRQFPQTCHAEPAALASFVQFVSACVASDSVEVSEAAAALFCALARDEAAPPALPAADPVALLVPIARQHLVSGDSTIALRYGALVCSLAGSSDALFSRCLAAGALDVALQLCRAPDALVQVCCMCCAVLCVLWCAML
jgi:hypothetical protein